MRRRIYLYIGDELADLDDDSFVLVNLSREEMTDPQAVQNAWTQAITLPNTGRNAAILGNYYRLDRRTTGTGGTGINFAALKRTPFRILTVTGEILMKGYLKLESASEAAFSVTLYGGLGQFFYDLTYDGAGNKLTLADCPYRVNTTWKAATEIYIRCWRTSINAAWNAFRFGAPNSGSEHDIINFAPCLNGTTYPFKFDTNKAAYKWGNAIGTTYPNIYYTAPGGYDAPGGGTALLLQFGDKHNEWEVQDLRSYCQRPIISLRMMMEGIRRLAYNLGYTLQYDAAWFNDECTYLNYVWMTLPFVDRDNLDYMDLQMMSAADFLRGTLSPAEYLVAIAKTFGFIFETSTDGSVVYMRIRDNFYPSSSDRIDLTDRIDRSHEMTVRPYDIDARFYDWQVEMAGIFCDNYERKYGRKFGSLRLDTGYDFDKAVKDVTASLPWKGCTDVYDASPNYAIWAGSADPDYGSATSYLLKFAITDSVKWRLEAEDPDTGEITSKEFSPEAIGSPSGDWYNGSRPGQMWMVLPQLHDADGKAYDKGGVLLFFQGMVDTPVRKAGNIVIDSVDFHLSDDNQDMLDLNGGVPCWDVTPNGASTNVMAVEKIPQFRRTFWNEATMQLSLDWGDPLEVPNTGETFRSGCGLYPSYWSDYMADRLDQDGSVLTAWVDLDGLQVCDALFRHFFYYEGALWVLNKVKNYSITTLGPTECEFVRVKDTRAYNSGQLLF